MIGISVELGGVAGAAVGVEGEFQALAGLGVFDFQFAIPGRLAIFVGLDLHQNQFVAEVGEILQGLFAIGIVQEIGDHDHQAALRVLGDKGLATSRKLVRPPAARP